MKILHIGGSFFPEYLGRSVRLYNMISRLPYSTRLIVPNRTTKNELITKQEEDFGNIHVSRLNYDYNKTYFDRIAHVSRLKTHKTRVSRILKKIKTRDFDLIHGHNPSYCGAAALKLAQFHQVPFVYEAHGLNIYGTIPLGRPYIKRLERSIFKSSDSIIALTESLKREIVRLFKIPEDKITVVLNGVDFTIFSPNPEYEKKSEELKQRLNVTGKIVLYIGYMDDVNGIDNLAKVIPNIIQIRPDITFIFIGYGPADQQVKNLTDAFDKNVIYLGEIPYTDTPIYYDLADLFIVPRPSTQPGETLTPLKLLEAMAMGKKVLGSDVGGIAEVITHNENGFLYKKNDLTHLTTSIMDYIDVDGESIGSRAIQHIRTYYQWETSAEKVKTIYEDLVST